MLRISWSLCFLFLTLTTQAAIWSREPTDGDLEHTKDSLETVKQRIEKQEAILVDVRELVEWDAGHVQSAVFLPWRSLQDKFDEDELRKKLPDDKLIYTYCAVGYRALRAGKIIAKYGYDVRPLKPGYEELVKVGFKSEKN